MPKVLERSELDIALGLALRVRRHAVDMSQAELGDAVDLSFQQIQKYERGTNRVSFSVLVHMCRALRCHAADLVADVERLHAVGQRNGKGVLEQPEAAPLLDALAKIRSPSVRRALLELARNLAEEPDAAASRGEERA
jgi:transcriptional regulator with XRE-family HTH domain